MKSFLLLLGVISYCLAHPTQEKGLGLWIRAEEDPEDSSDDTALIATTSAATGASPTDSDSSRLSPTGNVETSMPFLISGRLEKQVKFQLYRPNNPGCLQETPDRVLRGSPLTIDDLSLHDCADFCGTRKAKFFSVANGTDCRCAQKVFWGNITETDVRECNIPCGGNSTELCGGSSTLTIYTNTSPANLTTLTVKPRETVGTSRYIGCYPNGALLNEAPNPDNKSIEECVQACRNYEGVTYRLSALNFRDGRHLCNCATGIVTGVLETDPEFCNVACPKNSDEECGGPRFWDIYEDTAVSSASSSSTSSSSTSSSSTPSSTPPAAQTS